ncbi:MAG: helix-turn-helix transcriptional regulator [Chloroflexota bacterium]
MLRELLKQEVEKQGLSSREASKVIGVSHTTIIRALRGDVIDLDTIVKIADWMNVRPAHLLDVYGSNDKSLADRIAIVLERNSRLLEIFTEAIGKIQSGEASPDIIEDIAAYAGYVLDIKRGISIEKDIVNGSKVVA